MRFYPFVLFLLAPLLFGCAASASFTQTGETYPAYEGPVEVYFEVPEVEYERIGIVSSQGGQVHQRADMLKAMQEEAAEYGANAIIILSEKTEDEFVFSATEFGAFGGTATQKNASAVAVRVPEDTDKAYQGSPENKVQGNRQNRAPSFSAGASVNLLPVVLGGYGGGLWVGSDHFRAFGELYNLDIPGGFLRDGPEDGRIAPAYRFAGQYFVSGDLSGSFFSFGIESTTTDVGYEGTSNRTTYDSFYFSSGYGYVYRFNRYLYIDSRLSLNFRVGEEEICIENGGCFLPDRVTPAGFIGVGANF